VETGFHAQTKRGEISSMTDVHLRRAIELSRQSVSEGGGPFGAVVVLDGHVIGEGKNRVVPDGDATAHAEINAIRDACRAQGSHALQGAVIYASCEPCPMCLGAIWWARISRIVFANSRDAAANIGFDDAALYGEVSAPLESRRIKIEQSDHADAKEIFEAWARMADKARY
jgi:guanine deaminase